MGYLDTVSGALFFTPGMCEPVSEGLLFEVPESVVANFVEGSVTEDLQKWLVVYCNGEVLAPQDKMSGFVQGVGHRECFTLDGGIPRFGSVCESAPHKCDLPAQLNAE